MSWGSWTGFGLGVGCWSGWDTGPRSTGFSGCGRTWSCPTGFWGPRGRPCRCSRGTCAGLWSEEVCLPGGSAGFLRPAGAPCSVDGRCTSRDTGPLCTPSPRAGRDAGPTFAGSPRTSRSARSAARLDRATGARPPAFGTLCGPWLIDRWGVAGPAGSGTFAGCFARDGLSAHNNRPSATRTQVVARTHRFRTATPAMPLLPSAE